MPLYRVCQLVMKSHVQRKHMFKVILVFLTDGVTKRLGYQRGFALHVECVHHDTLLGVTLEQCLRQACAESQKFVEFYDGVCMLWNFDNGTPLLSRSRGGWDIYQIDHCGAVNTATDIGG